MFFLSNLVLGPAVFDGSWFPPAPRSHLPLRSLEKSDFLMPLWLEWVFGAASLPACPAASPWPSCPVSPGQECSAAAFSPSIQRSSQGNQHWFPSCCQPQVLRKNTPCPHDQLQTNKPDTLRSRCWLQGFQSVCVPASWLLIFWQCYYLRVSLFISEKEKELNSATTLLTTWSKELVFFPSKLYIF